MKKYGPFVALVVIILGAFVLHTYKLSSVPPLDIDEYGIAYDAYSIATTGHDSWGVQMPVFFRAFGDYKLPLDIYLSAFFFKVFEPSVFWLRFPAVLFALLYIPTMYVLLKTLTKCNEWAFIGASLIAILPYNLFYSHIISASISASYLIFASLTFFILALQSKHTLRNIVISTVLLSLSLYAYPLSWIIGPLLIVTYTIALLFVKKLKYGFVFLIFAISFLPIILQFFVGGSSVRLSNTSAFSFDRGGFIEIGEFRQAGGNDIFAKAFYNKGTTIGYILLDNYVRHFNIQYLAFNRSDPGVQTAPSSPLYIILVPFYFFGLFYIARKFKDPIFFTLLAFILLAPLPSVITEGAVNAKRYLASMGMETVLIILAMQKIQIQKYRLLTMSVMMIFLIEVVLFYRFFFRTYTDKAFMTFSLKTRIVEETARRYWPEQNLMYTTDVLGEPQIYPLVGTWYPTDDYLKQRTVEERDNWFFVRPFNGLFYGQDMKEITEYLADNPEYQGIGVFSRKELSELPETVCFDPVDSTYPYKGHSFLIVQIKPCSL
ncbi:glycosyltransferase family 39 protein [Candidatus Roizmanbacteria bacterium]|nr:MAG: glycosyltransferase family 39 protein [Candidatus Roizmanbacteria bacterium]